MIARPGATVSLTKETHGREVDYVVELTLEALVNAATAEWRVEHAEAAALKVKALLPGPARYHPDRRKFRIDTAQDPKVLVVLRVPMTQEASAELVEHLRAALLGQGYNVEVEEERECAVCGHSEPMAWARPAVPPEGWLLADVCNRHEELPCERCESTYFVQEDRWFFGHAPQIACEVCKAELFPAGPKRWRVKLYQRK